MTPSSGEAPQPRLPTAAQARAMQKALDRLHDHASGFPGAWDDHPWGELVVKVGKKIFVFFGMDDPALRFVDGFHVGLKLPMSNEQALLMPHAAPSGYGLGKAGWVSFTFPPGSKVPVDILEDWIDESYRAVATKTLVKQLDATAGTTR